MDTFVTIIEVVELGALIALVIYLIRLTRDNNELRNKLNKSDLLDRNLDELNEFNSAMVADPDIARIWQDGCADYRLNDIDRSRFSLLATQYLSILTNQKQRADAIEDWAQSEAATSRLVEALMTNPGLVASWETLCGKLASPELRGAVNQILSPLEVEEEVEEEKEPQTAAEQAAPVTVEECASVEATDPEQAASAESSAATELKTTAETAAITEVETVSESSEAAEVQSSAAAPDAEQTATEVADQEEEIKIKGEANTAVAEQDSKSDDAESDVAVAKPA